MPQETIKLSVEHLPSGKIRYRKMFKGQRFQSETFDQESRRNKQLAWQEFKLWREAQKREQEQIDEEQDLLRYAVKDRFQTLQEFSQLTGDTKGAKNYQNIIKALDSASDEHIQQLLMMTHNDQMTPIIEDRKQTVERMAQSTDSNLTAKAQGDAYINLYKIKAQSGEISTGRYSEVQSLINRFVDWFGENVSMESVSKTTVSEFYAHLMSEIEKGENRTTLSKTWSVFKTFVENVAEENDSVFIPSNLRSKKYTISPNGHIEPKPFTIEEVKLLLNAANDRMRLYILLALNCGMYQSDVATLKATEIDWQSGRIIRARSKTRKKTKGKIKVNTVLWDETWELLQKLGNKEGTVFLNNNGGELVRTKIVDGKEKKVDNIRTAFHNRLIKPLKDKKILPMKFDKTFKQFRKTSANLIEKSEHAEFYGMFLEHSSIARKNYLTNGEIVPKFDQAIVWLGKEFGLKTKR